MNYFIEIKRVFINYNIWVSVGFLDIKKRYRRSVLGPFWVTLSTLIISFSLSFIYSKIFKLDFFEYFNYLIVGFSIWSFVSTIITESANVFNENEGYIKNLNISLQNYIFKVVFRNLILFTHNLIIIIPLFFYTSTNYFEGFFFMVFAIILYFLFFINVSYFLGIICVRFKDVVFIIINLIQLIFFVTPILWKKEQFGDKQFIIDYNPFYHLVEIFRGPYYDQINVISYYVVAILILVLFLVNSILHNKFNHKIVYWT
tara:strand:+ start:83 stop:856 length:774 start_codon:yes stop_codon:yes gene_type:complete